MVARFFSPAFADYLASPDFSGLLQERDLQEIWSGYLDSSRDRPNLYGEAVMQDAFGRFLQRAFFREREEFPRIFAAFLAGFSRVSDRPLPLRELKADLADLGYRKKDLDGVFSGLAGAGHTNARRMPGRGRT